jgi:hypothetical protein
MKLETVTKTRKATRKRSIKPGKATHCYNCLSFCHNPCHLDEIYKKGHRDLVNCTAFNGKEECGECHHSVDFHGHTDEISEEYDLEY